MTRMGDFPGRKPADGCKCLTKNLRMGHNFDIILSGNGWFSSKFWSISIVNSLRMDLFLASFSLGMGQFSNPVATHPCTNEIEAPPV